MRLVGKFTEKDLRLGNDKKACEKIERETNGEIRYFITKIIKTKIIKRNRVPIALEVYGMTTKEYCESKAI